MERRKHTEVLPALMWCWDRNPANAQLLQVKRINEQNLDYVYETWSEEYNFHNELKRKIAGATNFYGKNRHKISLENADKYEVVFYQNFMNASPQRPKNY